MNLGGVIHLNKRGIYLVSVICCILILYGIIRNNNYIDDISNTNNKSRKPVKINLKELLKVSITAAVNGGKQVVDGSKGNLVIKSKGLTKEGMSDDVTSADLQSHCVMVKTLKKYFPNLNLISEEEIDCNEKFDIGDIIAAELPEDQEEEWVDENDITVWIDPLDATHEYTEKLYKFVTTMVCIAVNGKPIIGVIHKPFSNETSWAWVDKTKSNDLKKKSTINENNNKLEKIIISRSHSGNLKEILNEYEIIIAAGAGYKSLKVANGEVDAYIHITAIKKWDLCAGNAILNAQGGQMTNKLNQSIDYSIRDNMNKNVVNEQGLVATLKNHQKFLSIINKT